MKQWFLIRAYIRYRFQAMSAHGVHSPFVFNFIKDVLEDSRSFYAFEEIKLLRKKLAQEELELDITDLGAGSLHTQSNRRKVKDIARLAGRTEKYGRLLFRMVDYFGSKNLLELGTSLGLGTSYLAKANEQAHVVTIEGSKTIADYARSNFAQLQLHNVEQLVGNFDDVLPALLASHSFDFIFFDGNHREDATKHYFNLALPYIQSNSVFVFDDIHWTQGMERAWNTIHNHPQVTCSIDLFYFGLVFFNPDFKEKQHFVLRY